jgi:mannose-binding lectin 2
MNFVCLFALSLVHVILAEEHVLEGHTLTAPFRTGQNAMNNKEQLQNHWKISGSALIHNNYVRLTPEKQSQRGGLWSTTKVGVPSFYSILEFRISGTGKSVFGDGIGLWIAKDGYYGNSGQHGFTEKFYGVGVIFDTFRNSEHPHKDVTVVVNNNEKSWDLMLQNLAGCDSAMRYYTGTDVAFSSTDKSRAKVILNDTNLEVMIDLKNTGQWRPCVSVETKELGLDWLKESHIGLTASTGQLVDNHDILSFRSFSSHDAMDNYDKEGRHISEGSKYFQASENLNFLDRIAKIEDAVASILDHIKDLDHHLEHQLANVGSTFDNMHNKIDSKVADISPSRYQDDDYMAGTHHTDMVARSQLGEIQSKLADIDSKASKSTPDTWKLPFFILLIILIGGAIGMYMFYNRLRKIHIL